MTSSTSTTQETPSIFSARAISHVFQAIDDSTTISTSAQFKEGTVDVHSEIFDLFGGQKFYVCITTPNTQAHIELAVPKNGNQSDTQIIVGADSDANALVFLAEILESGDFNATMIAQNKRDGIIDHRDSKNLKNPKARKEARKTFDRINVEMTKKFRAAFEVIARVNDCPTMKPNATKVSRITDPGDLTQNNLKPGILCMQANLNDVCVNSVEIDDKLMVTLVSQEGARINFASPLSRNIEGEVMGYNFPQVIGYRGPEQQFKDMVDEVVDFAVTEELASLLDRVDLAM